MHSFDKLVPYLKVAGFFGTTFAALVTMQFGWSLGENVTASASMAGIFVLCTFVVGYAPVAAHQAWRRGMRGVCTAAIALTCVSVLAEIVAHASFSAANRDSTIVHARHVTDVAASYKARLAALQEDEKRIQARLADKPKMSDGEAKAVIASAKAHKWWSVTTQCTETKGPQTREWCDRFRAAEAAVSGWTAGISSHAELERVQNEIATLLREPPAAAVASAESQSRVLASTFARTSSPTKEQSYWATVVMSYGFAILAVCIGSLSNIIAYAFDTPGGRPQSPRTTSMPAIFRPLYEADCRARGIAPREIAA